MFRRDFFKLPQIVRINVFKRFSDNLYLELKINIYESLMGINIPIKFLNGNTINIKSNPEEVIQPNSLRKIIGLGMPCKSIFTKRGDLIIKFELIFPIYIEDYELKKLKIIFAKDKNFTKLQNVRKTGEEKTNKKNENESSKKKKNNYHENDNIKYSDDKDFKKDKNRIFDDNFDKVENENTVFILEKTEKKIEEFYDHDHNESEKKRKRYFYSVENNEENLDEDNQDIFRKFRKYTIDLCQIQ